MATFASLPRATRAVGIAERHEVIPCDDRDGFFFVSDSVTGSGRQYLASATSCTCADASYRGACCKHQLAVIAEERVLTAYAQAWDALAQPSELQPARCPHCRAELLVRQYYAGGVGYRFVETCPHDGQHHSRLV